MGRWLAFIVAALVIGWMLRETPTSPVAAPQAPLGYYVGEYPKQAPVAAWRTGRASWYECGRRTASGERFNPAAMTCAHKSLPFGTRLEVRYHGKTVQVRVSDRGPYVPSDPRRVLDLSQGAFARLAPLGSGVITVQWRKL
jgi:rare lipoprotein A